MSFGKLVWFKWNTKLQDIICCYWKIINLGVVRVSLHHTTLSLIFFLNNSTHPGDVFHISCM